MRTFLLVITFIIFIIHPVCADTLTVLSTAFEPNTKIPAKYTCRGVDINPQLNIAGIPEGTKSLALIVDDPDTPVGTWIHWVVYNIPVTTTIPENSIPGIQGMNDFKKKNYGGPCPPFGTHRYFFKVYALDTALDASEGTTKAELEKSMVGHIFAKGELVGLYTR